MGQILETQSYREVDFPINPPERITSCHFDFSLVRPCHPSDPQKCKLVDLGCFMLLSVWQFVTAVIEC